MLNFGEFSNNKKITKISIHQLLYIISKLEYVASTYMWFSGRENFQN